MRKSLVALLLATGATAFVANLALAQPDGDNLSPKLMNGAMSKELMTRAARLGASATVVDTTYVGYTPGHVGDNYWSIWSGSDKFSVPTGPYRRPPAKGAMWDFEPDAGSFPGGTHYPHDDSLQGWWSYRNNMTGTGGLVIPDEQRPWVALDYGNNANYEFGKGKRTVGVTGVWHVDGGNTVVPPASTNWGAETDGGVKWAPLAGSSSAWMGLRRHGDFNRGTGRNIDPITNEPFTEDVMKWQFNGAVSLGGSDKKFPGYGAQMDQLLYRDIDVTGAGDTSLTISFQYRTEMSTLFSTSATGRRGWFVHDPLAVITGGTNPNFIQNNATVAQPPVDSLMVYVGAPSEGSVLLSDGNSHSIYDSQRRWMGEVIRSNEGLYKEIFSVGGSNASTNSGNLVIPKSVLDPIRAASVNGTLKEVRLVFRVKTNQQYDDETVVSLGYSSGGVGAAIIDNVTVAKGTGGATTIGSFEAATDIDNANYVYANNVSANVVDPHHPLLKWHATGKPPEPYHHVRGGLGTALLYQDLCGPVGDPARICNMQGAVVSAGVFGNSEKSSAKNSFGTAEQEPFQGIWSPTINLSASGAAKNNMGLTGNTASGGSDNTDADATDDYYVDFDLYTGIFDFFNQGNAYRFGWQSYPGANSASGAGEHKRWGEVRFPGFIEFNPDKQCYEELEAIKGNGLLRTTNVSGIPDSCIIYVGTRQEAYRFGIPQSEWAGGAYWDNLSLDIVDGEGADPVSVDIWQLTHDTFSFNDDATLVGTPAAFDTTTALVKTGINTSPTTGNTSRFDVPGDTTVVIAEGDNVRVDLVFRILPGPGNYVTRGVPSSGLRDYNIHAAAGSPIPAPGTGAQTNFWSQFLSSDGPAAGGSPAYNGAARPGHSGSTWNPQVWNIARCDTAELNIFQMQSRVVPQPADAGLFMSAYHEAEWTLRKGLLNAHNVCFIPSTSNTVPTSAIICTGGDATYPDWPPAYTSLASSGYSYNAAGADRPGGNQTWEGTKIIPDGVLTPGAHVEYFYRRQDGSDPNVFFCPDTNVVTPQNTEGSIDGHRWQEFGVLPDRWKSSAYTHPVLGTTGAGDACMLYVDQNDRRGNERVWVGVADSIGATRTEKYGAHNGWHAAGDGDVNDPASFVRKHIGMPGTTWDMLGVKASESLNTGPGSLGSRGGVGNYSFNNAANSQINGKTSRIGPSKTMLETYYRVVMLLSGDLNSSILGPFTNKSQNDFKIIEDFMLDGNQLGATGRGFFVEGDGFVESMDGTTNGNNLLNNYLGVSLRDHAYQLVSGNTAFSADINPTSEVDPTLTDIYGIRNACTFTLDVLNRTAGLSNETAVSTFYEPVGASPPYISGVVHHKTATNPWISLVDGWNISQFHSGPTYGTNHEGHDEYSTRGRLTYFFNVFTNVFHAICDIQGAPTITTDTPGNNDGRLFNFMSLANNPMRSGSATVDFGLAKAERVKIQIFDVSGRLVRSLADRSFTAGEHKLTWDGADNQGRQVARGVYFVRSQHADSKFTGQSKLIVLK